MGALSLDLLCVAAGATLGLAFRLDGEGKFSVVGESVQLSDPLSASKGGSENRNIGYGSLVVADEHGRHLANPPSDQPHAVLTITGNTLTITRDLAWISALQITVTVSDGQLTDSKTFTVTVT